MAVTVLLVDDVEELRGVVRQALRLHGGFNVVAEAADGTSAVAAAAEHRPDVVVLDLGLPDLEGQEVVARLRDVTPESQVVIFTGTVTAERAGLTGRVAAFVRKEQDVAYLVDLLANLSRDRHHAASARIGPDLSDVGRARQFVVKHCAAWGCTAGEDDAKLVVTELVTNALLHAGTPCELRLRLTGETLRVEVEDGGGGVPDIQAADGGAEHGRGLLLVSALCLAWGIDAGEKGKIVWGELPVRPDAGDPGDRADAHSRGAEADPGPARFERGDGGGREGGAGMGPSARDRIRHLATA